MFKSLPGFRDFYPEDCAVRNHIFKVWRQSSRLFGFEEYDAPVLEPLELFTVKSGDEIVEQLFNFQDRGERPVALRPEMTPSLARLVGARANGMIKPIKWFNIGEHFRYERPQKGRLRSFYQLNCDLFGEPGPLADAEIIALLIKCFTSFGLKQGDFCIRLSDRDLWVYFLQGWDLDDKQVQKALAIIDKMEREKEENTIKHLKEVFGEGAEKFFSKAKELSSIHSFEELKTYLKKEASNPTVHKRLDDWDELVNALKALNIFDFVKVDLGIVRGLAYYTGFVFEAFQLVGQGRALAGGGRYDYLVKKLGGPDLHAVGFAIGDVTLKDFLEQMNLVPKYVNRPDFFAVCGGVKEREAAFGDITNLRDVGIRIEYSFKEPQIGKQLKQANQLGAKFVLIYGADELKADVVTMKELSTGKEEKIERGRLVEYLEDLMNSG